MQRERDVELQIVSADQARDWFVGRLRELGLTETELNEQAISGEFTSDRARRLWMASPNAIPKG